MDTKGWMVQRTVVKATLRLEPPSCPWWIMVGELLLSIHNYCYSSWYTLGSAVLIVVLAREDARAAVAAAVGTRCPGTQ